MTKTQEQMFAAPAGVVFEACKRAALGLKYKPLWGDDASLRLAFNTGRSIWTWQGWDVQVSVFPEPGGSRVVLGATMTRKAGGLSQIQAVGYGEDGRVCKKFFGALSGELSAGTA